MNDELTKRTNPFERQKDSIEETKRQEEPVIEDDDEKEHYEEPTSTKRVTKPVYTQTKINKPARNTRYIEEESVYREKYTSTMDVELRRTIKIICATRGIMFAQFIEDACKEKLQREGVK